MNGSSLLQSEKPELEKQGYSVVVQTYDPTNTINMTPQLEALKAAGVQVLIASGFGAPAGYILKARAQIGWNVPVVGDSSFSANPLTTMASAAALKGVNVLAQPSAIYKPLSEQNAAFTTLYNAVKPASGTFEVPFVLYECGWDTIMVAQAAANQAKSFDPQALTNALQTLKAQTSPLYLLGNYKYSASQHSPVPDVAASTLGQSVHQGRSGSCRSGRQLVELRRQAQSDDADLGGLVVRRDLRAPGDHLQRDLHVGRGVQLRAGSNPDARCLHLLLRGGSAEVAVLSSQYSWPPRPARRPEYSRPASSCCRRPWSTRNC